MKSARLQSILNAVDAKDIILDVDRVLLDLGFSLPEIDRIYDDMKTYIENNFTKEYLEEPVLNMKVGDQND